METEIFAKLGASPIVMDFTDIFTALETGVIDGADASGLANNVGLGLYDLVKNATYPGFHSMPSDHLACNKDVWDGLREDLKRIMDVATQKLAFQTALTFEVKNNEAAAKLRQQALPCTTGRMYESLNFWLSRTRGGIAVVTSIMAVIMAAMSGIIGGEVVLLGLIALPQMLRLGYNQNLAIGTICASGSLGTMIPPSIVLIMYGLITETSIVALLTASFVPGFMLASFFIIYIIIRTRLRPHEAPLPEPTGDEPTPGEKASARSS